MRGLGGAGVLAIIVGTLAVWRVGDLLDIVSLVVILVIALVVFRH